MLERKHLHFDSPEEERIFDYLAPQLGWTAIPPLTATCPACRSRLALDYDASVLAQAVYYRCPAATRHLFELDQNQLRFISPQAYSQRRLALLAAQDADLQRSA